MQTPIPFSHMFHETESWEYTHIAEQIQTCQLARMRKKTQQVKVTSGNILRLFPQRQTEVTSKPH